MPVQCTALSKFICKQFLLKLNNKIDNKNKWIFYFLSYIMNAYYVWD